MKLLITGANGQLGRELEKISGNFTQFEFDFAGLEELDICDSDAVKEKFEAYQPDILINCAAYTQVDKAEEEEGAADKANHLASAELAKICAKTKTKFIHISTDFVFDGSHNRPIAESEPPNPLGVYGESKLKGEDALFEHCDDSIVIRTSWLYGNAGENFVKTIDKLSRERSEIAVVSDQVGTPTYAADLALVLLRFCEKNAADSTGIFHFSNEGVASWYDFACSIVELNGSACAVKPISSAEFPTMAERPKYSVLDKSKIKSTLDLRIDHWRDALKRYFEEEKKIKA